MGDEPKPLVFPPKKAGGDEPRPLDFSKMNAEPKPLTLPPVQAPSLGVYQGRRILSMARNPATTNFRLKLEGGMVVELAPWMLDQIRPDEEAHDMDDPKPLALGGVSASKITSATIEPRALGLNPAVAGRVQQAPEDARAARQAAEPRGLGLAPPRATPIPDQPLTPREAVRSNLVREQFKAPSERVIGGDPRAPALMTVAIAKDPAVANDPRFRGRLEQFLKLGTSAWLTWGEKDMRVLTDAASKHREHTSKLSIANAVQWAQECEHTYSRPPGFMDRFARSKPDYYRVRLEQARDILQTLSGSVAAQIAEMLPRIADLRLDALVLEIATTGVTEASQQILANNRLGNLVQGQQTAMMILQSAKDLEATIATQASAVNDRLNVTIPNWILAMSKA